MLIMVGFMGWLCVCCKVVQRCSPGGINNIVVGLQVQVVRIYECGYILGEAWI